MAQDISKPDTMLTEMPCGLGIERPKRSCCHRIQPRERVGYLQVQAAVRRRVGFRRQSYAFDAPRQRLVAQAPEGSSITERGPSYGRVSPPPPVHRLLVSVPRAPPSFSDFPAATYVGKRSFPWIAVDLKVHGQGTGAYAAGMWEGKRRQAGLLAELIEWQEDLWWRRTGSRIVLVNVPVGWGRTTALNRFQAEVTRREDAPVSLIVRIDGLNLPDDAASQSVLLRERLVSAAKPRPAREPEGHLKAVELLGLDEPGGQVQLGLEIGGLFLSGLTAGISLLLAGLAVGAAQKVWDTSSAGEDGELARAARALAAVSVHVPVTVVIDDADCMDQAVAIRLAENLTARWNSQVLVIAAVEPGSRLASALASQVLQRMAAGLVHTTEADPDMGYSSRLELARQLLPSLPDAGARRIAQRTASFAEVFNIAAAPRLADAARQRRRRSNSGSRRRSKRAADPFNPVCASGRNRLGRRARPHCSGRPSP